MEYIIVFSVKRLQTRKNFLFLHIEAERGKTFNHLKKKKRMAEEEQKKRKTRGDQDTDNQRKSKLANNKPPKKRRKHVKSQNLALETTKKQKINKEIEEPMAEEEEDYVLNLNVRNNDGEKIDEPRPEEEESEKNQLFNSVDNLEYKLLENPKDMNVQSKSDGDDNHDQSVDDVEAEARRRLIIREFQERTGLPASALERPTVYCEIGVHTSVHRGLSRCFDKYIGDTSYDFEALRGPKSAELPGLLRLLDEHLQKASGVKKTRHGIGSCGVWG